ncbi:hypothetical protein [Chenggangzhangella methanolivorans]|uniref:Uncharacterized protein n=1 Tax=Chenggangzhangella methanolivorans TaxID=1437009 RepID=A0A9E6RGE5_9HYPH|nr:hypothetical protein [Chenggangzhangella methanolivorans]QZO00532.1 hypothetical protein K6K41_02030 [Chenggangzhangella methanolivorans]
MSTAHKNLPKLNEECENLSELDALLEQRLWMRHRAEIAGFFATVRTAAERRYRLLKADSLERERALEAQLQSQKAANTDLTEANQRLSAVIETKDAEVKALSAVRLSLATSNASLKSEIKALKAHLAQATTAEDHMRVVKQALGELGATATSAPGALAAPGVKAGAKTTKPAGG